MRCVAARTSANFTVSGSAVGSSGTSSDSVRARTRPRAVSQARRIARRHGRIGAGGDVGVRSESTSTAGAASMLDEFVWNWARLRVEGSFMVTPRGSVSSKSGNDDRRRAGYASPSASGASGAPPPGSSGAAGAPPRDRGK